MNENYFETPNTENCYWAGFIAGDGCVRKVKTWESLSICLSRTDKKFLETFKKIIGSKNKIVENPSNNSVQLTVSSKKLCKDLRDNFNITPKKTFTLDKPNIKKELIPFFIIGIIDADGCIHKRKDGNGLDLIISSGSKKIIFWCKKYLDTLASHKTKAKILTPKNIFEIRYGRKRAREILYKLNSFNCPHKLKRKWGKVLHENLSK